MTATNAKLQVADNDPAHADRFTWARMFRHIGEKGWQAGSLVGSVVVGPAMIYRSGSVMQWLPTTGKSGLVGIGLASLLGAVKLYNEPVEFVEDRVYRLYYNEGQNRVDKFCRIGFASGLVLSVVSGAPRTVFNILGHAALGSVVGLGVHALSAPKPEKPAKTAAGAIGGLASDIKDSVDKMG